MAERGAEFEMVMTLDLMSQRYHMLPSQLLDQASTLDYFIFDRAMTYENKQRRKAEGKPVGPGQAPKLSEAEMKNILARTAKRKK